jgi:hypothetical protein
MSLLSSLHFCAELERQFGREELAKSIVTASSSDIKDPMKGNRFWAPNAAVLGLLVTDATNGQQLLDSQPGWGKFLLMMHPRALAWAIAIAPRLMGEHSEQVKDLPVASSSIPVFNAAAYKRGEQRCIIVNAPLLLGLETINGVLFAAADEAEDRRGLLPRIFWSRRAKEHMGELWGRYNHVVAWLMNPLSNTFPRSHWHASKLYSDESDIAGHNQTYFQALFILLHEYAHIVAGHFASAQNAEKADNKASNRFTLPSYATENSELASDALALQWISHLPEICQINGKAVPPDRAKTMIVLSLTHLFFALASIEGKLIQEGEEPGDDEHPLALIRWALMCTTLRKHSDYSETVEMCVAMLGWFSHKF